MITTIARKEFTEIVRDGRFRWMAAILLALLMTALLSGWQRYEGMLAEQRAAQSATDAQFVEQGPKNPHAGAHFGNYAFKPAGPLTFFDNGVENYTGVSVWMEAHIQNPAENRRARDRSAVQRFGDLTGGLILQVLLPLMIIFLGFTAFSGERERGTLRQLMSLGLPARQLLWGKALGIGAAVAIVLLPCLIIGGLLLATLPADDHVIDMPVRTMLLVLAYTAYAATFLFLTLAVSAIVRQSQSALLVLVGIWAFGVFLAPRAAAQFSEWLYPTPAAVEIQRDIARDGAEGLDGMSREVKLMQARQALMEEYQVTDMQELPVSWTGEMLQTLEEIDFEVFDHHFLGLQDTYLAQQRISDRIGLIAPMLVLRTLSMGLSGTDLLHHFQFVNTAETVRRDMVTKMNADIKNNSRTGQFYVSDGTIFSAVEEFESVYQPPQLGALMAEYRWNWIVLLLWLAGSFWLARQAVGRLEI
ncbi:MAG: ABC transporter permease subunit [Gammaproteobacteria bacterium]|nr:ABC transporter permease subunit [Gammaproteobacteria bacterium]